MTQGLLPAELAGGVRLKPCESAGSRFPHGEPQRGRSRTQRRQSLNRVILTQKGDFSLLQPMMWLWGRGTGRIVAVPCLLGSGARPVRRVRSTVNRCHLAFAT